MNVFKFCFRGNSCGPAARKSKAADGRRTGLILHGREDHVHGFDRYDFVMDAETLALTPFKAPAEEGNESKLHRQDNDDAS